MVTAPKIERAQRGGSAHGSRRLESTAPPALSMLDRPTAAKRTAPHSRTGATATATLPPPARIEGAC